jgi:plastocyanin
MRTFPIAIILGVGSLGLLCSTPGRGEAHGPWPYGYAYYTPAVITYYAPPCPTVVYPPPVYYPYPAQTYGQARPGYPSPAPVQPAATVNLGAYDNYFGPATVRIPPGTTVRWTNYGRHRHTVTANAGQFDSGELAPGGSYSVTFHHPGVYYYYCRLHPTEMRGTVVVQ